jgi:hypothetical protein
MSTEQEITKKDYMSVPELLEAVIKVKSKELPSDEDSLMSLLDTAIFHISELRVGIDKTREDVNRATVYANNLRTELRDLLEVAQSYLQESYMVRQQLDEVKKDINGNSN